MNKPDLIGIASDLQLAAFEPQLWPETLSRLSRVVGGKGAIFFMADSRLPGPPVSPELVEANQQYFVQGWNKNDVRYRGFELLKTRGLSVDQDYTTAEERERSPFYQDFLRKHDGPWSASVGFYVGNQLWNATIMRSKRQGPFEKSDAPLLLSLARPLSDAAMLASRLGSARIQGVVDGLDLVGTAAILLDHFGRPLSLNQQAGKCFSNLLDKHERTIRFSTSKNQAAFDALLRGALAALPEAVGFPATIVIRDKGQWIKLSAVTLRGWIQVAFQGAHVLLLLEEFAKKRPEPALIEAAHGLTRHEASLASLLCSGASLVQAAEKMGIAYETARSRVKIIFAKTGTHRQSELVALMLSSLPAGGKSGPSSEGR